MIKMFKVFGPRLGLIVLGILISFMAVEVAFRITGVLLLTSRELRNQRAVAAEGTYRILCLGESTTQNQWPPLLQEELDKSPGGVKFKVIDKGNTGIYTGIILSNLDQYLNRFNPQMVVVMMGINDGEWIWRNPLENEEHILFQWVLWLKNLRVNKLGQYIFDGLKNRKLQGDGSHYEEYLEAAIQADPLNEQSYLELGNWYRDNGEQEKAKKIFESGIKAIPGNAEIHISAARAYRADGDYDKAESLYKAGVLNDPKYSDAYIDLGYLYRVQGRIDEAEKLYKAGIVAVPNNTEVIKNLADLYRNQNKHQKAMKMYEAAIESDPRNSWMYLEMGKYYREAGMSDELVRLYEAGAKSNPNNPWIILELGRLYREKGDDEKADAIFAQGDAANRGVPKMEPASAALQFQMSGRDLGRQRLWTPYPPPGTIQNYQKIRDRVLKRGMKLVCMQYPMRDVDGLRNILGIDENILYVENKVNFNESLKTHKLTDIFQDMFAGDFGHCTDFGNRLIAKNLAQVILSDVQSP